MAARVSRCGDRLNSSQQVVSPGPDWAEIADALPPQCARCLTLSRAIDLMTDETIAAPTSTQRKFRVGELVGVALSAPRQNFLLFALAGTIAYR